MTSNVTAGTLVFLLYCSWCAVERLFETLLQHSTKHDSPENSNLISLWARVFSWLYSEIVNADSRNYLSRCLQTFRDNIELYSLWFASICLPHRNMYHTRDVVSYFFFCLIHATTYFPCIFFLRIENFTFNYIALHMLMKGAR